jgi:thioredoxin 1
MADITEITTESFESVTGEETPVLVDFWAEWCAPCRAIVPILKDISTEYDGRVRIGKLDVDEHPDIARRYGVMSIPTLILFAKGEEKARLVGARSKDQLLREIEPHLA